MAMYKCHTLLFYYLLVHRLFIMLSALDLDMPLTSALLDFALTSIEQRGLCWVHGAGVVRTFKVLCGCILEEYVI